MKKSSSRVLTYLLIVSMILSTTQPIMADSMTASSEAVYEEKSTDMSVDNEKIPNEAAAGDVLSSDDSVDVIGSQDELSGVQPIAEGVTDITISEGETYIFVFENRKVPVKYESTGAYYDYVDLLNYGSGYLSRIIQEAAPGEGSWAGFSSGNIGFMITVRTGSITVKDLDSSQIYCARMDKDAVDVTVLRAGSEYSLTAIRKDPYLKYGGTYLNNIQWMAMDADFDINGDNLVIDGKRTGYKWLLFLNDSIDIKVNSGTVLVYICSRDVDNSNISISGNYTKNVDEYYRPFSLDKNNIKVKVNETFAINVINNVDENINGKYTTKFDKSYIESTEKGEDGKTKWKAIAPGESYITIENEAGFRQWCKVTVVDGSIPDEGGQCGIPEADVPGGTYQEEQTVRLTTSTDGADIYYTTDGSEPNVKNGVKYTGAIRLSENTTLKAIAVKAGIDDSDIMTEIYDYSTSSVKKVKLPALYIGENRKQTVKDKKVKKFFPGDFEFTKKAIPLTATQEVSADGSYKLNIAIGVEDQKLFEDQSLWSQYKKDVEDLTESMDRIYKMKRLASKFGGKKISNLKVEGFEKVPELTVMGYYELHVDKNGNVVSNTGRIEAEGKWKESATRQFWTNFGPVYLNLGASGKIKGQLGAQYIPDKANFKQGKWKMDGSLTFVPGVSIEGGYGVDKMLSVGAKGEAEFPYRLIPASSFGVNGAASVHVYLFMFDKDYPLLPFDYTFWDTQSGGAAGGGGGSAWSLNSQTPLDSTMKPIDRSFADDTSSWNGSGNIKTASVRSNADSELVLQSGIMPSALPMIEAVGDERVMVFQRNNSSKAVLDSSELVYSVCRNGSWSQPQAVWNTGGSDLYADLERVGNDLYLVWQKEKDTITSSESDMNAVLSEMAKKSEICIAKYDPTSHSFENPQYITDNDTVDMMPKLAVNGNKITAVWVTNSSDSFMQEKGKNQIVAAVVSKDGAVGEKTELTKSTAESIEEISPFYDDGKLHVSFVKKKSAESETNRIWYVKAGGKEAAVSAGNAIATDIQYFDHKLYYFENSDLHAYSLTDGKSQTISVGEGVTNGNAKIYKNDKKTAIIWNSVEEDENGNQQYCVYSSVLMKDGFSNPVPIYQTDSMIQYLDAVLSEDGSWNLVMNTSKEKNGNDVHSLVSVSKQEATGLEVNSLTVDGAADKNGNTEISYIVTNVNETKIDEIQLNLSGNGVDKQITIPVAIAPGETIYGTKKVNLSEISDTKDITLSANAPNQAVTQDNSVKAVIGQTDLSVEATMAESDEDVCIVAKVSNLSDISSSGKLTVYSDAEQTVALDSVNLQDVTEGTPQTHTFYLKKSELKMNEYGSVCLPVVVKADKADGNEDNNTDIEIAYNETIDSKEFTLNVSSITLKKKQSTTKVKVTNLPTGDKVKSWKSSNTKIVKVSSKGKITAQNKTGSATITVTTVNGATAKLKVKVQKGTVKTTKISGLTKTVTVKKGKKYTLKPVISPITSVQKVTYSSSNKKIATVSSKGVITGKKKGKAKITVKSGSKKYVVTVTVK